MDFLMTPIPLWILLAYVAASTAVIALMARWFKDVAASAEDAWKQLRDERLIWQRDR